MFWIENDKIRVIELNTITFGVSSAPFLAIRTVHRLASDESAEFPVGAEVLRDLYVDDLLLGADTFEKLIQIRDEVIEILKRGGFDIHQWATNHPRALNNLVEKTANVEFLTDENPIHNTRHFMERTTRRFVIHGQTYSAVRKGYQAIYIIGDRENFRSTWFAWSNHSRIESNHVKMLEGQNHMG